MAAHPDVVVRFDGGSRGNPGPAAYGFVVSAPDGAPLAADAKVIGVATNNVAEYRGLVEGLRRAAGLGARRVRVIGDSQLVIRQMRGEWRVRNAALAALRDEARALAGGFEQASFEHAPRAANAEADLLVNAALDAAARG